MGREMDQFSLPLSPDKRFRIKYLFTDTFNGKRILQEIGS